MTCRAKNREIFRLTPARAFSERIKMMRVKQCAAFIPEITTLADNLSAVPRSVLLFDNFRKRSIALSELHFFEYALSFPGRRWNARIERAAQLDFARISESWKRPNVQTSGDRMVPLMPPTAVSSGPHHGARRHRRSPEWLDPENRDGRRDVVDPRWCRFQRARWRRATAPAVIEARDRVQTPRRQFAVAVSFGPTTSRTARGKTYQEIAEILKLERQQRAHPSGHRAT